MTNSASDHGSLPEVPGSPENAGNGLSLESYFEALVEKWLQAVLPRKAEIPQPVASLGATYRELEHFPCQLVLRAGKKSLRVGVGYPDSQLVPYHVDAASRPPFSQPLEAFAARWSLEAQPVLDDWGWNRGVLKEVRAYEMALALGRLSQKLKEAGVGMAVDAKILSGEGEDDFSEQVPADKANWLKYVLSRLTIAPGMMEDFAALAYDTHEKRAWLAGLTAAR
jgi:hypothetical protein